MGEGGQQTVRVDPGTLLQRRPDSHTQTTHTDLGQVKGQSLQWADVKH